VRRRCLAAVPSPGLLWLQASPVSQRKIPASTKVLLNDRSDRTCCQVPTAAKYFRELKRDDIDGVLELCETLLETGAAENSTIAFDWAFRCRQQYRPEHFSVLERWLEVYADDWGSCDDLCTHALGDFVLRCSEFRPRVKDWTRSENRWLRRASAVSLIYAARKGKLLADIFHVTDALPKDPDDMVKKGCGWLLKVASKTHGDKIFHYVMGNRSRMSRVTLTYVMEKMPEDRRRQAMTKR
jgi:3-methyladenine DNA glycosylase AlkD